MADKNKLVKEGELIAFMILRRDKYNILHTNWKYKNTDIDIIATKDNFLVFFEVKTSKNEKKENKKDIIKHDKISIYKEAIKEYLKKFPSSLKIRFDIINISIKKEETEIEHITDILDK